MRGNPFSTRPEVWPDATPEEFVRVEEAVRRLAQLVAAAGYWTPVGKAMEALMYAVEPDDRDRAIVDAVLPDRDGAA